ncbi:MAG TPA: hypothetical protein VMU15_09455 [Anaeromyxobacter sp.]|nr:hypothetical protein [Anaeromyxobacter sp.]
MRRANILSTLTAVAAILLFVPLRSDGGLPCDNVTTSLQSTVNNPVAGDEKFFTLPVGPSNVMFMLDVSGSMNNIPQCGDGDTWGASNALSTCQYPSFASLGTPAIDAASALGTCSVSGNSSLSWMANYDPTANALVDPGFGTASNGLKDLPPWGTGCTGNNCLFQPTAVYAYNSWTETSATPTANPCSVTVGPYTDKTCSGNTLVTNNNKFLTFTLPNCSACLTNAGAAGFYFYTYTYGYGNASTHTSHGVTTCTPATATATATTGAYFSGGWLNANPPKFMSARKVIKNTAWIDPAHSANTDQLRIGLSYMSSATTSNPYNCPVTISNGSVIVVPVGPSQANSYPPSSSAYVTARQLILDALNHTHGGAAGWPSGVTLPSLECGGTPMATGLFHLGQYFTQPGTYTTAFGSSYELTSFAQTSKGLMNASWVDTNSKVFCWYCQKSAVIIVTDGSPNSEMTFPTAINSYDQAVYTQAGNCGAGTTCSGSTASACCSPTDTSAPAKVPRIAAWLHEHDLSPSYLNGNQLLMTSAVSFNLAAGNAQTILQATANMGGGTFNNAADGAALASGVAAALNQVSTNPTSFGTPAATALTTINAVDTKAFITRFKPNQKATWEGHLFEWMLFDEAAAGCDPTKKPDPNDVTQQVVCRGKTVMANFNGDADANGFNICTGSFLVDADCDEVVEDSSTGIWYKKGSGNTPAHMFWDAGSVLSTPTATGYRTAAEHADTGNIAPYTQYAPGKTPRNIWTATPDGTMYELETKNAATLAPYMNLDSTWCSTMETLAKLCGSSPLPSCPVTDKTGNWQTYCAQQVILFARGWDVLDQDGDGCAGPGFGTSYGNYTSMTQPNPNNGTGAASNTTASGTTSCAITTAGSTYYTGEERDRPNDAMAASTSTTAPSFYKLADIFHSSPVLVHPPTSEAMCRLGTDNQCVRTLFGYTSNAKYAAGYQTDQASYTGCTTAAGTVDAYRAWRTAYAGRENVVLVGSNDGFLHAFDAGGQDTSTGTQDLDCAWPNVQDGTGQELWALLPPDLLPRLRDTMLNHQYMVDGNTMVRDIWVDNAPSDGSTNNTVSATGNSLDGVKQKNEFRTVAIFGERSGGTQYTALDVTNAFSTTASVRPRPTLRWTFPPPRSDDAQYMGESWSDFSPRPPPIGPVQLYPGAGDVDPQNKHWVEKWIVMLNGGYDPTLNRGRAVWTLDAWTGSVYWRFTDTDFKANVVGSSGNTTTSMFPVTAAVGLVDLGDPSLGLDSDNFFDTATWGDLGGDLFVARFDTPGHRDVSGRVTNWRAARTFEQGRRSNDAQYSSDRNEFYYMTANAYEPQRHQLRVMLGSGNREQILQQGQGCGPDNLMSCCQAGCSATTSTQLNYGVCSSSGGFTCSTTGQMTSSALTEGCGTSGASACTSGSSGSFTSTASYNLNCGSAGTAVASGTATCDSTGLCTVTPVGSGHDITPANANSCADKARFYGIWAYGGVGVSQKTFSTAASADWSTAVTFDTNRFTDVASFSKSGACAFTPDGTCSLVETTQAQVTIKGALSCQDGSSKCQATVDDPGWFYTYNVTCPTTAACSGSCTNEKTASGAALVNSCATWNSFVPLGSAASGSDPCSATSTAQQSAIGYASNFVTGTPDTVCNQASDTSLVYRGMERSTIAPPAAPMVRMGVSSTGRVYYSTLQLDPGSPPTNTGLGSRDVASTLYWLEVSRQAHACRHEANSNCK